MEWEILNRLVWGRHVCLHTGIGWKLPTNCVSVEGEQGEKEPVFQAGGQQRGAWDKEDCRVWAGEREGVVGAHDSPPWKGEGGQSDGEEKGCGTVASLATVFRKGELIGRVSEIRKDGDSVILPCTTARHSVCHQGRSQS